ncbi:unnamed protein product [Heligmosomoides polygyrus]|uniref:Uncharacterized protein n=1 Tax=Heligmosomoides polygyrus TaxID=6339 RepID=A0A183FUK1_HELPZ|nr:unnamed protein product [Heligmosomoides polygyrus]
MKTLSEVPDGIATAAAASENAVDYGVESDGHDDIRTHHHTNLNSREPNGQVQSGSHQEEAMKEKEKVAEGHIYSHDSLKCPTAGPRGAV